CSDRRHRLWINHRWALYVPQLKTDNLWLACCYNENCLQSPGLALKLRDLVFDDFIRGRDADPILPGQRFSSPLRQVRPAGLVYPLSSLQPDHEAVVYLRERGFDTDWLSRELQVGFCVEASPEFPMAGGRIVIPVTFQGRQVGWQARRLGDAADSGGPKYVTMPGMHKAEVLYNYDAARTSPFVVVCEGVSDVWSFGPEAVALFGKHISGQQLKL